jgi:hypothetical protein
MLLPAPAKQVPAPSFVKGGLIYLCVALIATVIVDVPLENWLDIATSSFGIPVPPKVASSSGPKVSYKGDPVAALGAIKENRSAGAAFHATPNRYDFFKDLSP